jgi:hypothetical protein
VGPRNDRRRRHRGRSNAISRWVATSRKGDAKNCAARAVNVKLLPAPHSTSFSGISLLARSTKFCPLQRIGLTCSRWNFYLAEIIVRSRCQVKAADKRVIPVDDAES